MKTDNLLFILMETFLFLLLFFTTSCRQALDEPPVIVSKPACLLTSTHGTFSHAGVSFRCHNTGCRKISSLEVTFSVFTDEKGGNPFYGSNVITAAVHADLSAGASGTFEVSLDENLAFIPDKPFLIDFFYVRKVIFEDGSQWSDLLGMYYAGSTL